jgi:hypothetical protein
MFARALLLLSMLLALAAPLCAQDAADKAAIRDVIEKQMEAFRRDDGEAAFGFASPTIRGMFGSADVFMDMVRQGYQPVYRPKSVEFGKLGEVSGQIAQEVHVIGPDGRPVTALYVMTQLPDGSWRIDGCYLLAPTRHQA